MAGCDKMVKCWDLASDQSIQVLIVLAKSMLESKFKTVIYFPRLLLMKLLLKHAIGLKLQITLVS